MSNFILTDCWRIQGISPTQKLVLISLADQANDDGVCWPSVETLHERTCLSERSVQRALTSLIELGLMDRVERPGRSCYYTITYRHSDTPVTKSPHPRHSDASPPAQSHPTPVTVTPRTIKNHKEPKMNLCQIPFDEIQEAYNQTLSAKHNSGGLPVCLKLTEGRKQKIRKLWNDGLIDNMEDWRGYFRAIKRDPVYKGWPNKDRTGQWRPDFDYLIGNNSRGTPVCMALLEKLG